MFYFAKVSLITQFNLIDFSYCIKTWLLTDGGTKKASLPKICHIYPAMIKLSTGIPYLKKIQKMYESRDIPLDFC